MPKAYSVDLRSRLVEAYLNEEGTQEELAETFHVSSKTISRYLQQYALEKDLHAHKSPGRSPLVNESGLQVIMAFLQEKSDLTLAELCKRYAKQKGQTISIATMYRLCEKIKWYWKKKQLYATEQATEKVKKSGKTI